MDKFDVIIAGAGTGGSLAARTVAEAGFRVCFLDRKKRADIGKKVCGDAIGRHHFSNLGLKEPTSDEVECFMEGVEIYSPDQKTSYVVKGEELYGFVLNRHRFGQRLITEAEDAGAVLYDQTQVLDPILEAERVCGVKTKNLKTQSEKTLRGSLVIEASGFMAALRKKLPPNLGIDRTVDNQDVEACYREIRSLNRALDDKTLCQIYLNQTTTPGGYYWVFPKKGNRVNVGLGVAMVKGFPRPKDQLYQHVLSQPLFAGSSIIEGGAWYVPTRRPLNSMVGNGVLVVGDAACQVNPIHGGGIGPSMIGGKLAGETAVKALQEGILTREALWEYNTRYISDYGAKQAGLEVFRILLQSVSDEDLNYGMHHRLLTEEDLLKASLGDDIHFSITEKARRVFKGLKNITFLRKLRNTSKLIREVKSWYQNYPSSPAGFEKWKTRTDELFKKTLDQLTK
ncbi:MAG: NAD(P)/FAD-dependent oxidoreductase [Candidatus Bathyarchaeota archaeon]|nr:MAG: NAD(P)/FAD-dependent oxidoreductase [Candidatus Bathyarchaeota archaeon]